MVYKCGEAFMTWLEGKACLHRARSVVSEIILWLDCVFSGVDVHLRLPVEGHIQVWDVVRRGTRTRSIKYSSQSSRTYRDRIYWKSKLHSSKLLLKQRSFAM